MPPPPVLCPPPPAHAPLPQPYAPSMRPPSIPSPLHPAYPPSIPSYAPVPVYAPFLPPYASLHPFLCLPPSFLMPPLAFPLHPSYAPLPLPMPPSIPSYAPLPSPVPPIHPFLCPPSSPSHATAGAKVSPSFSGPSRPAFGSRLIGLPEQKEPRYRRLIKGECATTANQAIKENSPPIRSIPSSITLPFSIFPFSIFPFYLSLLYPFLFLSFSTLPFPFLPFSTLPFPFLPFSNLPFPFLPFPSLRFPTVSLPFPFLFHPPFLHLLFFLPSSITSLHSSPTVSFSLFFPSVLIPPSLPFPPLLHDGFPLSHLPPFSFSPLLLFDEFPLLPSLFPSLPFLLLLQPPILPPFPACKKTGEMHHKHRGHAGRSTRISWAIAMFFSVFSDGSTRRR
ncbi:hypothetical protein C7M84_013204 [Penaeus vannamei]|uniref:Uncharacterized protein n=1 Tax=Penaeus vannamei TaxID=6689 RepID=A0A423SWK0_PENVA|nr:hypothetical protein C7M84_013204 [Penaeus vannamei]